MLPEASLPFRIVRGRVLPGFLDDRDLTWVRVLIEEVDRFAGSPLRELAERLRFKTRAALGVLMHL